MAKKDPHPTVAKPTVDDAAKYTSTEWRFAVALIENKMNATEAARVVFKPGKKGAKDPDNSAKAMGSRMLTNVNVRSYINELALAAFNPQEIVDTVNQVMRNKKYPGYRLSAAELAMKASGMGAAAVAGNQAPIVNLVMPTPPTKK